MLSKAIIDDSKTEMKILKLLVVLSTQLHEEIK